MITNAKYIENVAVRMQMKNYDCQSNLIFDQIQC